MTSSTINISSELMTVQHRQAILKLESEQLKEREKFLRQSLAATSVSSSTDEETEDETEETPAPKKVAGKKAPAKKAAVEDEEELEASDSDEESEEEADLDDAFSDDEEETTAIGDDDVRELLQKITKSKGDVGKKKARAVMAKYTKNRSGLVKDIMKGSHSKIHAELKKI